LQYNYICTCIFCKTMKNLLVWLLHGERWEFPPNEKYQPLNLTISDHLYHIMNSDSVRTCLCLTRWWPYAYGWTIWVYGFGPDHTRMIQIRIWSGTYTCR
jgi:hypothetical protein